jgi:ATP-dependent helicase/nuclease subunit A
MTVHGAKGLESEIVILPDTADRSPTDRDVLYADGAGQMLWKTPSAESPPVIAALRAQKQQREAEENSRLLYVALTRARCWLIVAGHGKVSKDGAWHKIVSDGMARLETTPTPNGLRHQWSTWPDASLRAETLPAPDPAPEDWMFLQTERPAKANAVLSPSDLGGAKALAGALGDDTEAAKARGTALHLLLQHLPDHPPTHWPQVAAGLLGDGLPDLSDQAKALLTAPALQHIFTTGLSEVALTAPWGDQRLLGTIDRLIVYPDHVLAVDFKSNRTVPATPQDVPEGILRQMGAYQAMLEQLYTRPIHLAILWTQTGTLMPLGPDIVRAALGRTTTNGVTNP